MLKKMLNDLPPFYLDDEMRGADILASHAAGIPSFFEGKRLGWYKWKNLDLIPLTADKIRKIEQV